ncbi:PIN domain-containing protein [Maribacter polysiphoniae]|uniref:PIN domain-containing protein n=1 Tax=Maribacter polysiphoniae TaxID=429344 RepID=A0A316E581_9FLAO|nr:PIN domain-containing protein [Maribacter polysiphoniae]MBD1259811.1 PIN domain-containing protein [Maribacter polysiphoniae]PWK25265.1 PIN domain-containing protein [Maribacter polysiphoniae]
MSYTYFKANSHQVKDQESYFLDANIWLKVLAPKNSPSFKDKAYLEFFEKIINNTKVRIVLPALVVSEVINRIIREVYYQKHISKIQKNQPGFSPDGFYYKNVYRSSSDYGVAYNLICDDLKSYHSSIDLINDEFGSSFKFKHVLSNPPISLDFNDYYYYNLCKRKGYFIVTDDKDFWVKDVKIVTMSPTLLDKHIATLIE